MFNSNMWFVATILDGGGLDTYTHAHFTGTGTVSDMLTILPPWDLAQCPAKIGMRLDFGVGAEDWVRAQ